MKPTFFCNTEHFFNEWGRWVKFSPGVNRGYYFFYKNLTIGFITAPDFNLLWVMETEEADEIQKQELRSFGIEVISEFHLQSNTEYSELLRNIGDSLKRRGIENAVAKPSD